MTKVIIGTQGRINALLAGMNEFEFVSASPFGDGKVMIVVKGEPGEHLIAPIGEPIIKEVEVIKEVDNPKLVIALKASQTNEQKLIETIGQLDDQLAACQKENKALKTQNAKLKKAIEAI